MFSSHVFWLPFLISFAAAPSPAANLKGVVHDPQHRPVQGAAVRLESPSTKPYDATSDANGEFTFRDIPAGAYSVTASAAGFQPVTQAVPVSAGQNPVLHLQFEIAAVTSSVQVTESLRSLSTDASTVRNFVAASNIEQTAGADQTNSLAMITDFTPGASMVHDMLHVRGGHQVNWFIDDIPVENTSIAANVAPLINPKNVEELEVERGGYSSEYGDRTYGLFNVVTPSGFDRDNDAEIIASAGNFGSTDDQFNFGGHTQKFAYYASFDGSRSDLGLNTPASQVIHDGEYGLGGFLSLLYNPDPHDQFRLVSSSRYDNYQIPNDPGAQAAGVRDSDAERDTLVGFHWAHTFEDGSIFTLTPSYHYNAANYFGGPNDTPYILNDLNNSNYLGVRSTIQIQKKGHNAQAGIEVWAQHDSLTFNLMNNPGGAALNQLQRNWANSESLFFEDQYKAASWLTFNLGLRMTHYAGLVNENAADPRLGAAIRIPKIGWIVRGYYAYYYQPPPLDSLAGPSLDFAVQQGYGFVALRGERDIQHDFGLTIPLRGWSIDADQFHTSATNFLDHDVIGNSGIFIPLTDLGAIVSGTEVSVRSPELFHTANLRIAYSNQIAQGIGPITGGLLQDAPAGNFLLDHDQRNTLSTVLQLHLPHGVWATPAYQFGSGFLNGNGPAHLPPHSTFDLSLGKTFREHVTVSVNATNIGNSRYLLDTSNTFGGTHYVNPRQIYGEVRYRFHL